MFVVYGGGNLPTDSAVKGNSNSNHPGMQNSNASPDPCRQESWTSLVLQERVSVVSKGTFLECMWKAVGCHGRHSHSGQVWVVRSWLSLARLQSAVDLCLILIGLLLATLILIVVSPSMLSCSMLGSGSSSAAECCTLKRTFLPNPHQTYPAVGSSVVLVSTGLVSICQMWDGLWKAPVIFPNLAEEFSLSYSIHGNGLFMHFCDLNHQVTWMQQGKKQQHQRAKVKFMLMKIQNIRVLRFSKLMIMF